MGRLALGYKLGKSFVVKEKGKKGRNKCYQGVPQESHYRDDFGCAFEIGEIFLQHGPEGCLASIGFQIQFSALGIGFMPVRFVVDQLQGQVCFGGLAFPSIMVKDSGLQIFRISDVDEIFGDVVEDVDVEEFHDFFMR